MSSENPFRKKFPNLPLKNVETGAHTELDLISVPSQFAFLASEGKKAHIVEEENCQYEDKYMHTYDVSAICGRECGLCKMLKEEESVKIAECCDFCLRKLDDIYQNMLYDEKNDEFYHP